MAIRCGGLTYFLLRPRLGLRRGAQWPLPSVPLVLPWRPRGFRSRSAQLSRRPVFRLGEILREHKCPITTDTQAPGTESLSCDDLPDLALRPLLHKVHVIMMHVCHFSFSALKCLSRQLARPNFRCFISLRAHKLHPHFNCHGFYINWNRVKLERISMHMQQCDRFRREWRAAGHPPVPTLFPQEERCLCTDLCDAPQRSVQQKGCLRACGCSADGGRGEAGFSLPR